VTFGQFLSDFLFIFRKHREVDLHKITCGSRSSAPCSHDASQNSLCWSRRQFVLLVACSIQVVHHSFLDLCGLYSPHSR
jgi:hypothetical protein